MKILILLLAFNLTQRYCYGKNKFIYGERDICLQDTLKQRNDTLNNAIDEVIRSKAPTNTGAVKYVNQVTKYGFKSLFKNLSYNSAMPYTSQVNPRAENYMQDYLQAHENYLLKMKGSSELYFSLIDNILARYGLPKELKYLAVIESDLKPQALSWMGARGPWQFMACTARDYGLMVNGFTDERIDYYKSTNAAARYLLYLYKDLKDWLLVIAAYNGGTKRVYEAIKKSGSRSFWSLQYYLPAESRNHVKKFIATHYIMEGSDPAALHFNYNTLHNAREAVPSNLEVNDTSGTVLLTISGKYNSLVIARNLALEVNEFNRLNPGLDAMLALGNDFNIRLPAAKMDMFVANKYVILNECVQLLLKDVNEPTRTTYSRPLAYPHRKGK